MIVAGDWVLPVEGAPIRHGAVRIRGQFVREVGYAPELRAAHPGEETHDLSGCIIAPGLVNAHTHLALTGLAGIADATSMSPWLRQIARASSALDPDDLAASVTLGARMCLASGTTCVGDIAYGPESPSAAADVGLGGVFFWEVLGVEEADLGPHLQAKDFPAAAADACRGRTACGISAHAPYTSGPGLIRAAHAMAAELGVPFAMHMAESRAESRLLLHGTGELADVAERLAKGFRPPGRGAVGYLDSISALKGTVAVHCVEVDERDASTLAASAAGVVLCPRSNARLGNGRAPVGALLAAGCRIGLGTDSLASNADLDMFSEARALRELAPELTAERTLRILTVEGAEVLGVGAKHGLLGPGRHADLIAVEAPDTDSPVEALLAAEGRDAVRAVMSGGVWRVLGGKLTTAESRAEAQRVDAAREKARRAVSEEPWAGEP